MTSLLRVRANRLNALKSTGPRTALGKAKSSANSLSRGLRSLKSTVLPGESAVAWKKFATAVLRDLNPRGPVQLMWAGQIARLMWRLQSSADSRKRLLDQQWREAEILAPESAWWRYHRDCRKSLPASPQKFRVVVAKARRELELIFRVAALPDETAPGSTARVDGQTAVDLIDWATAHLLAHGEMADMSNLQNRFPGLGTLVASPDPECYLWTLGDTRAGLIEVAAWKNETLTGLLATLIPAMRKAHRTMQATLRRSQREMLNFRLCAAARSPVTFEKFDRYEASLLRSLAHATSQLQSLQSQYPDETSPEAAQTSQNVVQLSLLSLESPGNNR